MAGAKFVCPNHSTQGVMSFLTMFGCCDCELCDFEQTLNTSDNIDLWQNICYTRVAWAISHRTSLATAGLIDHTKRYALSSFVFAPCLSWDQALPTSFPYLLSPLAEIVVRLSVEPGPGQKDQPRFGRFVSSTFWATSSSATGPISPAPPGEGGN